MSERATTGPTEKRCEALFEDAMGHRSYARSLDSALSSDPLVRIGWHPVSYRVQRGLPRSPRFFPLHVACNARSVLSSVDLSLADCLLFHTHWVAVGASMKRLPPYVVSTDATPTAYRAADSRVAAERATLRSRPFQLAVSRCLARARLVVALSEWTAHHLIEHDRVPSDRLRVVPPGVDTTLFAPRGRGGDRVRIAFVGYDFDRKGGPLLLEWARTTRTHDWEMHLVSPQAPASLPRRVFAHRNIEDPRGVADILGRSDIFVLPTGQDIVPVAVIEALASGCAVVASSVGAVPELLGGGAAGALFRPGSAPQMLKVLDEMVSDGGRRHALSTAGRARAVERYSIGATSLALRSALLEACSA